MCSSDLHFLVITKEHIKGACEITGENSALIAHIFEVIAKLTAELKLDAFRVITNCGAQAGQSVFHLHFHVLSGRILGEMG